MKKIILASIFLFSAISFAQITTREIINGKIVADSLAIEGVTIFNKTSNKGAVSDSEGFFSLFARPNDTLIFSNVAFSSRALVLDEFDFKVKVVKVELKTKINELDEVVVSPYSLTGDLMKDTNNLKVVMIDPKTKELNIMNQEMNPDFYSTTENIAMLNDGTIKYGVDFTKVGKLLKKTIFKSDKKDKTEHNTKYFQDKIVPQILKEKFSYHFFHETLKLKDNEIALFLNFCESDPKIKSLLESKDEIYLIEFLINKREEFKNIKQ
ncbi:MAG: carboxypeptidase-like regulatory domain-containing protein [Flavobacterium sp.]